jgi:low affinity Fe/Cu permease
VPTKETLSILERRRRKVDGQIAGARMRRWRKGMIEADATLEGHGSSPRPVAQLDPSLKDAPPRRRWSSRQLHRLGEASSHAWAGAIVLLVAVGWVAVGAWTGFGAGWQSVLTCTTAVITVVMVFAIQHLQAREQAAVQRKLDEILRSLPTADNRLISIEEAPDEELAALAELNRADREEAAP